MAKTSSFKKMSGLNVLVRKVLSRNVRGQNVRSPFERVVCPSQSIRSRVSNSGYNSQITKSSINSAVTNS